MHQSTGRVRAIAEGIAAVGVVLSLLFVALQIRQNTVAIRAQTRQQLADASANFLLSMATTDLGELWGRFIEGDDFTAAEWSRLTPALVAAVRGLENVYLQYQDGVIDRSALESYGWRGSQMYESDAFAAWWQVNSSRFNPDFVRAFAQDHPLER